jgi:predicted nucleic acid-binding protein
VNVYVDSSVLLRVVLDERGALREWRRIRRPLASELVRLECRRTIDRARIREGLGDEVVAQQRAAVLEVLDTFDVVPVDGVVLERAGEPFPTLLSSLDAIHLATALLARTQVENLHFATHDRELGTAARAMGFNVLGLPSTGRRRRT